MLHCQDISYKIDQKTIFNNINLTIEQGNNTLILGPSGCGKTTLICMLAGLLKPTTGDIFYDNQNIYKLSPTQCDKFRGNNLGIVFQDFHLIKSLNVRQNLELPLYFSNKKIDKDLIKSSLKNLNLLDKINQKVPSLSIGEKQRLAILRSLIHKPKYIFCDEPTSALDDDNCDKILKMLDKESKAINASLIIVTHDLRVKSFFKNDNIINLK